MRYICTSIVATLILAGTSFAATINVPGDYPTIQAAVDAASHGDQVIVAPGTYTGTGDEVVDMLGKAITLRASGAPEETMIDGENTRGGIVCESGENTGTTIIEGFTITGGSASYGGGIFCYDSSSPYISGCTITGGSASYGGGIFCFSESSPTIINCTITGNTANSGGAIYCDVYSFPIIIDSQICGNEPEQLNGNWYSGGGNDITTSCPVALPPTGACCVSSGCVANSNDDCTAAGGTWLGEGGSCDDCAATCQGDANADGVVDVFDLLKVIDGWGICD